MEYISCNMGTCDLPEIYALRLHPRARADVSDKSLVPMLQLLHNNSSLHSMFTAVITTKMFVCVHIKST